MSASVWWKEVDTALIKLIKDIVKIPNRANKIVSVNAEVRKPDEDFKIETYPSVTVTNLFNVYQPIRQTFGDRNVVKRNSSTSRITLEKDAIPFDLYFQIDFWATSQIDMHNMTSRWQYTIPRYHNLDVVDSGGTERNVLMLRTIDLTNADYTSENMRFFRSYIRYLIQVELDENTQYEMPMSTDVIIEENLYNL